jgi:hypothetical protein
MQLKALLPALWLLASATAAPTPDQATSKLEIRQVASIFGPPAQPPIEIAFRNAGTLLEDLQKELRSWRNYRGNDYKEIVTKAENLQNGVTRELRNGARDIRRGPALTTAQGLKMSDWANAFTDLVGDSMDGWNWGKRIVNQANLRTQVLTDLKDFSEALLSFSDATNTRASIGLQQNSVASFKRRQSTAVEAAIREYSRA